MTDELWKKIEDELTVVPEDVEKIISELVEKHGKTKTLYDDWGYCYLTSNNPEVIRAANLIRSLVQDKVWLEKTNESHCANIRELQARAEQAESERDKYWSALRALWFSNLDNFCADYWLDANPKHRAIIESLQEKNDE